MTPSLATTLVVPCYNEERRLRLSAFDDYLRANPNARVLFVNDGSRDETLSLLCRFCDTHRKSCVVGDLPQNQGKGEAVRQGLLAAIDRGARMVGYWDADLAAPLRQAPLMGEILHRDPETHIVIGIRLPLLGRRVRRQRLRGLLGAASALLTRRLARIPTRDTQCGAKMFRVTDELRRSLAQPFQSRWLFDVELLLRLRDEHHGLESVAYEYPLESWTEQPGSKVGAMSYARALRELVRAAWFRGPTGHIGMNDVKQRDAIQIIGEYRDDLSKLRRAA